MMSDLCRPRGRVDALFRVILFLYLFWAAGRPFRHPKELLGLQLWSRGTWVPLNVSSMAVETNSPSLLADTLSLS